MFKRLRELERKIGIIWEVLKIKKDSGQFLIYDESYSSKEMERLLDRIDLVYKHFNLKEKYTPEKTTLVSKKKGEI